MSLDHGGRLQQAVVRFGRPAAQWLDLSTGINPIGWPVPPLPAAVWNRLPEEEDGLLPAAQAYYGCRSLLAVAGSQAAIQLLPHLRPPTRVALPEKGYAEHRRAWQRAGHRVESYPNGDPAAIEALLERAEVLLLINPNNPGGERYAPELMRRWHRRLAARGGWLVVDEAFIDPTPEQSLAQPDPPPGLLILRSVGKFFGLAGVRAGFVLAEASLCQALAQRLGPWSVSHPARWVCTRALQDGDWQRQARQRLRADGARLGTLLAGLNPDKIAGCALFQTLYHAEAGRLHRQLAEGGILTRAFEPPGLLRVGLPGTPAAWQRLEAALAALAGN